VTIPTRAATQRAQRWARDGERICAAYDRALVAAHAAGAVGRNARGQAVRAASAECHVDRDSVYRWLGRREDRAVASPAPVAHGGSGARETGEQLETDGETVTATGATIRTLAGLLSAAEVDPAAWQVSRWVANSWGNADDQRWQVKAWLERVPDWLADAGSPPRLHRLAVAPDPGRPRLALVAGDAHIGYRVDMETRTLHPYHDERALDLLVQLAGRLRPDVVILAGDMIDLPALATKFTRPPDERYTTTEALRRARRLLVDLRTALPAGRIVLLPGNHEDRLRKFLSERAGELATLRAPDGAAVLSVPALLWLDSLDVETAPETWAGPCRVWHGDVARRGGGKTAAEYVAAAHSQVVGHVHRVEYAERTYRTPAGPRTTWAASVGCLCRVDGAVPGSPEVPDWQQGCGLVEWTDDAAEWTPIPIRDGRARVGPGQWLLARDPVALAA